jgi:hypothetical protein
MNCRQPMPIAICPVPKGIKPLQCGEEYHASNWRSVADFVSVIGGVAAARLYGRRGGS